jgi:hypothetical protein
MDKNGKCRKEGRKEGRRGKELWFGDTRRPIVLASPLAKSGSFIGPSLFGDYFLCRNMKLQGIWHFILCDHFSYYRTQKSTFVKLKNTK